jgi:sugar fermentation stimulation protein A
VRRYKRFFADVRLASGEVVTAHCPNTGSLKGCLVEGARVWLRDSRDDRRKLRYTWQAVEVGGAWVNVDTGLPNRVVFEALLEGLVPQLAGYRALRREVAYGVGSRIDVLLSGHARRPGQRCFVEVKSTTLARGTTGLFPDAVTERGRKHLRELARAAEAGDRAVQLFFASREDVHAFRPADDIDPAYGAALRDAAGRGVEVMAFASRVTPDGLELGRRLRVDLRPAAARRGGKSGSPGGSRGRGRAAQAAVVSEPAARRP